MSNNAKFPITSFIDHTLNTSKDKCLPCFWLSWDHTWCAHEKWHGYTLHQRCGGEGFRQINDDSLARREKMRNP